MQVGSAFRLFFSSDGDGSDKFVQRRRNRFKAAWREASDNITKDNYNYQFRCVHNKAIFRADQVIAPTNES
jgi:hypothetical protein